MSNVPKAREVLLEIADQLDADGHPAAEDVRHVVQGLLHRTKAVRRMPAHSRRMSERVKEEIIFLAESTTLDNAQIAAEVGVNPGRVSETLHDH